MSKDYNIGDPVWAKMGKYPPWPSRIATPKPDVKKPKKTSVHWVYFFGTNNCAWIDDANINPYIEYKSKFLVGSKLVSFKNAVEEMETYLQKKQKDPNYDPEKEQLQPTPKKARKSTNVDSDKEQNQTSPKKIRKKDTSSDLEKETPTPPKKPRKDSGVKRTTISPAKGSRKKAGVQAEENGTVSPFTSSYILKDYEEVLNKPSILATKNYEDLFSKPSILGPHLPLIEKCNILEELDVNVPPSSFTYGFLGLGTMGMTIVQNLIKAKHKVNIWNRSIEKAEDVKNQADIFSPGFVQYYPNPSGVVECSDIIFCCVSDPAAVKDIFYGEFGILHNRELLHGKGYVEMTSIDDETSVDMSNLITSRGGRYLEAQLQGGKTEAQTSSLIIIGAGDKSLYLDCQACFKAIGRTIFYSDHVGFAARMNIALQVIKGIALAGLVEAFSLADRLHLKQKDVLEVFELTDIANPYLISKAELMLELNKREQPFQHMQKDTKMALDLADSLKLPLYLTATANEVYKCKK